MRMNDLEQVLMNLPSPEPPEDLKARCLATIPIPANTAPRVSPRSILRRREVRWAVAAVPLLIAALGLLLSLGHRHVLAATLYAMQQIRTVHFIGRERVSGKMEPLELWFEAPSRSATRVGTNVSLDDGRRRVTYSTRGRVAYARRSFLANSGVRSLTPATLLGRMLEDYRDKPGVRITRRQGTSPEGRRVTILDMIDDRHRSTRNKARVLIDSSTNLLVSWHHYEWQEGAYVLSSTMDKAEYNIPLDAAMPRLPDGMKVVTVDNDRRAAQRLVSVRTPKGNEVIVRTVDIAENGDVYLQLARGVLLLRGTLTDEHGRGYRLLNYNGSWRDALYVIFRPSARRKPDERLPTWFTLRGTIYFGPELRPRTAVEERAVVTLDRIPAPKETFAGKPPFEPFVDFWNWDPKG